MASGYVVSGRGDLDVLFLGRVNPKRSDVGYKVAGVDLSNRYETIGATTPIAATGFKSAGTDLANLFRGSGSTASAAVAPVSIFESGNAAGYIGSNFATCTVSGNVGAPTYQWVRVSGSSKVIFGNGMAASTNFISSGLAVFESAEAVFKCTVTVDGATFDAAGTCTVVMYRAS